jgi:phosphohistidine swiveling domain-containing protein
MKIIPKSFTRDFPLVLCQIWGARYKSFLGEEVKVFPRYIFLLENGLIIAYRNPDLTFAINEIFRKKIADDPAYIEKFCARYIEILPTLEKYWSENKPTRQNLLEFIDVLMEFWHAIYASFFITTDESFLQEYRDQTMELRKKIDKVEYESFRLIDMTLLNLFPQLKELARYITLREIRQDTVPSRKILEERETAGIIVVDDYLVSAGDFEKLKKQHDFTLEQEKDLSSVKEFKGQVAYGGKIRGEAQIIMKQKDLGKMKFGGILVSSMTVPTFLPAMQKAAAFVTDEGGITCHIAIVARELKKPCIIGTKFATQVLKDGDEVEVNADNGTVKILKRAN